MTLYEGIHINHQPNFFVSFSMQLAEEVLKSGPSPGEGEGVNSPGFEGMEALARAIELGEYLCTKSCVCVHWHIIMKHLEHSNESLDYVLASLS